MNFATLNGNFKVFINHLIHPNANPPVFIPSLYLFSNPKQEKLISAPGVNLATFDCSIKKRLKVDKNKGIMITRENYSDKNQFLVDIFSFFS